VFILQVNTFISKHTRWMVLSDASRFLVCRIFIVVCTHELGF
jgi:hypothetical protein